MSAASTAKLLASLDLDSKGFTRGVDQAMGGLGKLEGRIGKIGGLAARGLGNAGANIGRIGVVAGAGVTLAVKGGLQDLAELESAVTSVDGAIEQMGLTGQVTGAQVATWANDIERDIDAAFDDKAITGAATTLIRFGGVTTKNLKPALTVIADLATKTGDVDSAATLLAKALADPTKAAGKLSKNGIILTKVEQDQITAFVKVGKTAEAQAVILDAVAKATKGAAKASAGPYKDALNILGDVTEDARKALAVGFLPVIEKVADLLGKELAKPQTLENIKQFGDSLASGLDKLIDVARGLPWGTIGDSLKLAGSGAKAVLDAFTAMPSWIQTAVITGWGLNKLTGGALGGIVGELGKGLIKGVLSMNAGVVTIKAGTVVGGGGVGGAPGAGAAGGLSSLLGGGLLPVSLAAIAPAVVVALTAALLGGEDQIQQRDLTARQRTAEARGLDPTKVPTTPNTGRKDPFAEWVRKQDATKEETALGLKLQRLGEIGQAQAATMRAQVSAVDRTNQKLEDNRAATAAGTSAMQRAADALERKQQQAVNLTVNVDAQFTVRDIARKISTSQRLGFAVS